MNDPSNNRGLKPLSSVLLGLFVFGVLALLIRPYLQKASPPPPQYSRLPSFSLQERSGDRVNLETLRGKVWLADFIYIHCTGSCPAMTAYMGKFQQRWKGRGLMLVSITVDPKRDTLQALRQYADKAGADPRQWLFLRGKNKAVYDLAEKGFKIAAGEQQSEFVHSNRFILVGPQGWIRGYYNSDDPKDLDKLHADVNRLLGSKT
jgi:protein SCO1